MKRWLKWSIVAAILMIPAAAYAGTKIMADDGCCDVPGCPCHH